MNRLGENKNEWVPIHWLAKMANDYPETREPYPIRLLGYFFNITSEWKLYAYEYIRIIFICQLQLAFNIILY